MLENENNYLQYMRQRKVCLCNNVSESQIIDACKNGCDTLEKIQQETKACTSCCSCRGKILTILEREKRK